jgi:hypothetical protein
VIGQFKAKVVPKSRFGLRVKDASVVRCEH